jgi:hypothetical protein
MQWDPEMGADLCVDWDRTFDGASVTVSGRWNDPDGDPLLVTLRNTPSQVCIPGACAMPFVFDGDTLCGGLASPQPSHGTTADDGAAAAAASISLNVMCP